MAQSLKNALDKRQSFVKTIQPQTVSVSDMIKQEEAATAQSDANKLNKYFSDRSNIRKSLSDWTLKTWRPAEDAFNVRAWQIVDLYLDQVSQKVDDNGKKKFTTEQIIWASKDIPWTLQKMKEYYQYYQPNKAWAIEDYIQKWWVATNVFEYLNDISWTVTNPYWAKTQKKENVFQWTEPEAAKWVAAFGSFLPAMWTRWAWMLGDTKLWKWMDEKLYNTYHKVWDSASDEEYKQYKAWTLWDDAKLDATNMGWVNKRQLYEWYDNALNNWFVGSLDEYKNFEKNIHNATSQALNNNLKEWILTKDDIESSKGALIWDTLAEFITYMSMPMSEVVEVDSMQPVLNLIATAWMDSIVNTLEYAALEWLQWDWLSGKDIWDVWIINMLVSWITRSPALAKYLKELKSQWWSKQNRVISNFLSTLPERAKNAFENMNSKTLQELWDFAKTEATNPEERWILWRWLWEKWVTAVENIQRDVTDLWKQYETKISGLTDKISEKWFFKDINSKFDELASQWAVSWDKNSVPKLELIKDGNSYKVKITNKKNLNKIKNENGKWLWDAIQENVDSILEWYWIGLNKGSQYLIKQWVRNATKWTNWNVYEKQTQKLIEWLDNWELDMPKEVKDLWDKIHEKKKLLEMAQRDLWWIKWRYEGWKIWWWERAQDIAKAWEKMTKDDAIAIMDILKTEWYLPKNISSEVVAQWYLLWLENKNAWYSFLAWFYPSKAWEIEQILELFRQKATARDVEKYIRMLQQREAGSMSVWAVADMPKVQNAWRTMQKVTWYWAWETDLGNNWSGGSLNEWGWRNYQITNMEEYDKMYRQMYWD